MNPTAESDQNEGTTEDRAQRALTARLGAPLVRRSKSDNRKWSTWKSRLGPRKEERA